MSQTEIETRSVLVKLSEVIIAPEFATAPVDIHAFRYSSWDHPVYGKVDITPEVAGHMVQNFKNNVLGTDLQINYEHGMDRAKGWQAAGWVRDVKADGRGIFYQVEFTRDAWQEIREGKWRYFSPEYSPLHEDSETNQTFVNVATGGALTNQPFFGRMVPLNFSELFTEVPTLPPRIITKEGDEMDRETLLKFAQRLGLEGITDSVSDEDLQTQCFSALDTQRNELKELEPLRELKKQTDNQRTFAQQYPEEYARMQKLEADNQQAEARAFSSRFERFTKKEGDKQVPDIHGFSAIALDKIADFHKALMGRTATVEMFSELIELVASGDAIVNYGESGSNRTKEGEPPTVVTGQNARQQFNALVASIQAEDEHKDKNVMDLVKIAAQRNPELYEAYRSPMLARSN